MADQTVEISWDRSQGFTFEQNGEPLPGGNVTVSTEGTNEITFTRKEGQSWTFQSFSMSVAVSAAVDGASNVVTVGQAYGDTFSWSVTESEVVVTDGNEVPAGAVHGYEYSFIVWVPGVGPVPCDPKIYNRIQ